MLPLVSLLHVLAVLTPLSLLGGFVLCQLSNLLVRLSGSGKGLLDGLHQIRRHRCLPSAWKGDGRVGLLVRCHLGLIVLGHDRRIRRGFAGIRRTRRPGTTPVGPPVATSVVVLVATLVLLTPWRLGLSLLAHVTRTLIEFTIGRSRVMRAEPVKVANSGTPSTTTGPLDVRPSFRACSAPPTMPAGRAYDGSHALHWGDQLCPEQGLDLKCPAQ